jgi:hypothetical protein
MRESIAEAANRGKNVGVVRVDRDQSEPLELADVREDRLVGPPT